MTGKITGAATGVTGKAVEAAGRWLTSLLMKS